MSQYPTVTISKSHNIRSWLYHFYLGGFYTLRGFCNLGHGTSLSLSLSLSSCFLQPILMLSCLSVLRGQLRRRSAKPLWRLFTDYCLAKGEPGGAKRERIETASYKRHTRILPPRRRTNGWVVCVWERGEQRGTTVRDYPYVTSTNVWMFFDPLPSHLPAKFIFLSANLRYYQ